MTDRPADRPIAEGRVHPETLTDETKRAMEPPPDEGSSRWRFGLRHMLQLVFYCAIVCWLVAAVGVPAVVLLVLLSIVLIFSLLVVVVRRRAAQQEGLLAIIALAVDRQMPLGPSLDAISDQFAGEYRRKVRALAHYVNTGMTLPDALDREPGALPRDAEVLTRVGHESGTLAGALREASAHRGMLRPIWSGIVSRIVYFLFILYLIQVISGFLFYFITPKYQAILSDFHVEPPGATKLVFAAGRVCERWGVVFAALLLAELCAMLMLPLTMLGWSRLEVPLVDWLFDRRHSALILRSISWVVEGGMPLPRALEMLAEWYPSTRIRRRLRRASLDVRHGTDWVQSMVFHRVVRPADAAVLEAARRAGNLPWALRETAAGGERRLAYRLQAFLHMLLPVAVLALGGLVGLLVVAFMLPLIQVIEALL